MIVFFAPFWSRGLEFERLKRNILNNTIQPTDCVKFSQIGLLKKSPNINEKQNTATTNKKTNKKTQKKSTQFIGAL